jgi:hypothetical protein
VSMACGERVLLPRVREAAEDELVVTAGFSCRSQVEHATERKALHVAQVIQLARDGAVAPKPQPEPAGSRRKVGAALALAGVVALAFAGVKGS